MRADELAFELRRMQVAREAAEEKLTDELHAAYQLYLNDAMFHARVKLMARVISFDQQSAHPATRKLNDAELAKLAIAAMTALPMCGFIEDPTWRPL